MSHLLEARGLVKTYSSPVETIRAVDGVTLTLSDGEFVCLYGASGSGKSTLLHLLAGLIEPDEGSVLVDGTELRSADVKGAAEARLRRIGVVFQGDNLLAELSAWENVALPLEVSGVKAGEARRDAEETLALVGLAGLADRRPAEMSGGQRQRVGIARALVGGRRVLLADEPTGSLDSTNSRALFELLAQLAEAGRAVLVASHDPNCRNYASRSIEMVDGHFEGAEVGAAGS
ncbi:MAG: ABC transporter ATP-binding protein [Nocardioides sp.]|uniref:ABC transporter ATP-binding protein n=1 Tax=Nocardioides sp. TaxID=35761 RepID=UPI0039E712E0